MDLWVWAILLLAAGIGLAVLEIFFPSAGILGFLSAASIITAIVLGFQHNTTTGVIILGVAVVGVPTAIVLGLKWWPHTAMGRAVMLMSPKSEDVLPTDPKTEHLRVWSARLPKPAARCFRREPLSSKARRSTP